MAAARSRVSLPIFRAKNSSLITDSWRRFARLFVIQNHESSSASADIPLLQKLLKAPVSRIKSTLDSEFSYGSADFPWAALLSSLNTSAPQKANLLKRPLDFLPMLKRHGFLIQCCIRSKTFEDAQIYFDEMILAGLMPNETIFQNMLIMYCQQRNCNRVKEILKFLPNGKWRMDRKMAKQVANLYFELGLVEELEELLVILSESDQTSEVLSLVYCSMIRLYADKDRLDDVEYSVGRMLKHGISFSCEDDVEKVICSYFRKEAYDRLDLFLECIRNFYELKRSTYDLLGAGYRRAGLLEKLDMLVNEMKLAGFAMCSLRGCIRVKGL
ncbi:hypothetical protein DH2020_025307 [Rehmannia glutinosa]|uniref:Pentatricopeptide repeat-containing protein n=1 Tax=Rehmannia glutinosa TaxID=99300 RepID=A0ABR0W4E7_REHGL